MTAAQDSRAAVASARRAGDFVVVAFGVAGPQGSKKAAGTRTGKNGQRYTVMVESSKKVKPWREAVEDAATKAIAALPYQQRLSLPFDGPLEMDLEIALPRPARIPPDRFVDGVPYPTAYPDLSKLQRSTEDALTTAGVWADDARVVRYGALWKQYAGTPGALEQPGALIRVRQLGGGA